MLSRLSIVYPRLKSLRSDWYAEFDRCFTSHEVERIELVVEEGDVQISRSHAIDLATREFVTSPDPDDTFDLSVYAAGVRYLLTHSHVAAITFLEEWCPEVGNAYTPMPATPIKPEDVFSGTFNMHTATIFRTAVLKEAVAKLNGLWFQRYDWALRIYVAGNYPIHRIPKIGYRYRFHDCGIRDSVANIHTSIRSEDTYAAIKGAQLLRHH